MRIRDVRVGKGHPIALISGLNVIESQEATIEAALAVQGVAERHGFPVVFKASFDKANRTSLHSYRGPGLDEGLRILDAVKQATGMPLLTDVHEPGHAKLVAEVVDCLQVPAFLSRQTDLIAACAATGAPINLKKAQFMAPDDLHHVVEKARVFGAAGVMITERGALFGYHDLVVDFRGFAEQRRFAPLCFDATHSAQRPGAGERASAGNRNEVAPLARAAVAAGIDALFIEVHPDPENAPCDGQCQIRIADLDRLLGEVSAIQDALGQARSAQG
ncbi:MAG: 3-deoxy-8-phosphooctulonate synthase [Deltaproteobacteria bacterium]|nr:3-deoxy-8-phosphooctulonate synthase [Deltaproteobacteria bacterium]MBW2359839.1 3-deoxy-8-phosphooctulonate synthase [Deltaproteobacteria bacterium]